jgi:hypothetical protein
VGKDEAHLQGNQEHDACQYFNIALQALGPVILSEAIQMMSQLFDSQRMLCLQHVYGTNINV